MPKWLLFVVAALGNFVVALLAYWSGSVVIPIILVLAGLCFIMAAVGVARGAKTGGNGLRPEGYS
jgi:threonine/homoserine/homoserine lactone efflux protein